MKTFVKSEIGKSVLNYSPLSCRSGAGCGCSGGGGNAGGARTGCRLIAFEHLAPHSGDNDDFHFRLNSQVLESFHLTVLGSRRKGIHE